MSYRNASRGNARGNNRFRRNNRPGTSRSHDDDDDDNNSRPRRHPQGLRGKDIGLYYRNRQRAQNDPGNQWKKPLTVILISENRRNQIKQMLDNSHNFLNSQDDSLYNRSWFKSEFMSSITGNISEKLERTSGNLLQAPNIDEAILNHFQQKENDVNYLNMLETRERLPAFKMKDDILKIIEENQVVVISGETGCGKTTQVAQFILDDYIKKKKGSLCNIVCSQPRRISAITVAERVADERAERIGLSVGYHIRLEKKIPRERGSICFCTTGVILKQMERNPSLDNYSHIILDEIHERNVPSDFLITLLKKVVNVRKDLKVILMSATLNSEAFSKYYNNAPHMNIPGFTYPVKEYYLEDVIEKTQYSFPMQKEKAIWQRKKDGTFKNDKDYIDFIAPYIRHLESNKQYSKSTLNELHNPISEKLDLDLIFQLLVHICTQESHNQGAILVFLTGYMEISNLYKRLEESSFFSKNQYLIFPLHSLMPTVEQKQIFLPAPPGKRKIILSTNIAETSITIDDVVFVINCGKIKLSDFDVSANQETLNAEWVSLANASQRKGRAGRVQEGICYHLYTKAREMTLEQYQKPEILRQRLEDVILQAKMLQLGKINEFFKELMDPPEDEALGISLELLKRLNALDDYENLTPLGYHLAKLPMAPQLGKMVLFGAIFSCLDPILSVAVSLDFKDAFQIPLAKEKLADMKRMELSENSKSDHILLHNAIDNFENCYSQRDFCWEYFLSMSTLKLLQNLKKDFMSYLYDMSFVSNLNPKSIEHNVNSNNIALVKAVICAGLYPNIGIVRKKTIISVDQEKMKFHPKSVLSQEQYFHNAVLVAYYRRIKSSAFFIHDATIVCPLPIVFFGDHFENNIMDNGHHNISINKKLRFKCTESSANIIAELRDRLNRFLEYKVSNPGPVDWRQNSDDINILRAIMNLITIEESGDFELSDFEDFD